MSQSLSFASFAAPLQRQLILDGVTATSGTVWKTDIPPNYTGFLERVGAFLPARNTYYLWHIDGSLVDTVQYQIGHPNRPLVYNPPIVVKSSILWIAFNPTKARQIFTVLNDGFAVANPEKII